MSAWAGAIAALLPRLLDKLAEPSTKSGAVGLATNAAIYQLTPDPDPVQLVLQVLLALVQLYDIFRKERAVAKVPAGPQ